MTGRRAAPNDQPGSSLDHGYVWRAGLRGAVDELLSRARAGAGQSLLVTGEPGAGKSSLLHRIVGEAERSGFRSLVATADAVDTGVPYAPLRLALRGVAAVEEATVLGTTAEALVEAMAASASTGDTAANRAHVLELTRQLLSGWAFRGPAVLALDDLHAADADTLACVLYVVRHLRRDRFVVILTSRVGPDVDPALTDALNRFDSDGWFDTIKLEGLDDAELSDLVKQRVGATPDPDMLAVLRHRTGGNPFFAVELLDALDGTGALLRTGRRVALDAASEPVLPRTVAAAVLHRVFRLGADARKVAATISVLGAVRLGRLPLLADLAQLDPARTEDAFDVLVRGRVLATGGEGYRFTHPIVRDALYEDLGPAARRRLHERAAQALVDDGEAGAPSDVVEVAGHVRRAATGVDSRAAARLIEAGDAVVARAPLSAVDWYRDALDLLPAGDPSVPRARLKLSRALDSSLQHADAARVATATMATLPDGPDRVQALLIALHSLRGQGLLDDAERLLAVALADPSTRTAELLVHRAHVHVWQGRADDAAGDLAEARSIGRARDDALAEVVELHLDYARGEYAAAAARPQQLRSRVDALAPPVGADVLLSLCATTALNGDPREAVRDAERLEATPTASGRCRSAVAWAWFRLGLWPELLESSTSGPGSDPSTPLGAAAVAAVAAARAERGDLGGARTALRSAAGVPSARYLVDGVTALVEALSHQHAAAGATLRGACERERAAGRSDRVAFLLPQVADVAWRAGDLATGRAALDELDAMAAGPHSVAVTVSCLLARALIDGDVEAAAAARSAATDHALAPQAADALRVLGALTDDAAALVEAYDEFGGLGAVFRQREVGQHLRRLGRRVPRRRRRADELTPAELEVASLVARGLTNRQIATAAGLSPKTVEVYVSRIYAKTGCHTRVELAVAVTSGGIGARR